MNNDELLNEFIKAICEIDGAVCNLNVLLRTEEQFPKMKNNAVKNINAGNQKLQDIHWKILEGKKKKK